MDIMLDRFFNTLSHEEAMEQYVPKDPRLVFHHGDGSVSIASGDFDQTLDLMAYMKKPYYIRELYTLKFKIENYKKYNYSSTDIADLYARLAELEGIKEEAEEELNHQDIATQGFNLNFASTLSVTSTDITDITGRLHKNVMRDIRDMLARLGKDPDVYVEVYEVVCPVRGKMNKNRYKLPADLYFVLITGYSTREREILIDLWTRLEVEYLSRIPLSDIIKLMGDIDGFVQIAKPIPDKDGVSVDVTFDLSSLLKSTTRYARAMTSSEIAKEVGAITDDGVVRRHENVMRDIEVQFKELGHDLSQYVGEEVYSTYPNSKPRTKKIYSLPRNAALVLITGYLVKERYAVVRRLLVLQRGLGVTSEDITTLIEEQAVKQGCEVYIG